MVVTWSHFTQESSLSPPSPAFSFGLKLKDLCSAVEIGTTHTSKECTLIASEEPTSAGRSLSRANRQTSPRFGYHPDGRAARFSAISLSPRNGWWRLHRRGVPFYRQVSRGRNQPLPYATPPSSRDPAQT